MSDPWERHYWRGVILDNFSIAFMDQVEDDMGRGIDTVYQGSYNSGGVQASSGTHDGGGALDVNDRERDMVVRVMRKHGGAAWDRTGKGNWVPHVHVIIGGNDKMSNGARDQWEEYKRGGDGLSGSASDYHWRPEPIRPFSYAGSQVEKYSKGEVYVAKLKKGTKDSDSVRRLQFRLNHHDRIPARQCLVDGDYGEQTARAVKYWSKNVYPDRKGGSDTGNNLGNKQANQLFGDNYIVKEE